MWWIASPPNLLVGSGQHVPASGQSNLTSRVRENVGLKSSCKSTCKRVARKHRGKGSIDARVVSLSSRDRADEMDRRVLFRGSLIRCAKVRNVPSVETESANGGRRSMQLLRGLIVHARRALDSIEKRAIDIGRLDEVGAAADLDGVRLELVGAHGIASTFIDARMAHAISDKLLTAAAAIARARHAQREGRL